MNPAPENVEGRLVESHEFVHSVEHQVNWSHVLIGLVVLVAILKLGPPLASAASSDNGEKHR